MEEGDNELFSFTTQIIDKGIGLKTEEINHLNSQLINDGKKNSVEESL